MNLDPARRLLAPNAANKLSLRAGSFGDAPIDQLLTALGGELVLDGVTVSEAADSITAIGTPAAESPLSRALPGSYVQADRVTVRAAIDDDALAWSLVVHAELVAGDDSIAVAIEGQPDEQGVLQLGLAAEDGSGEITLPEVGKLVFSDATVSVLASLLGALVDLRLARVDLGAHYRSSAFSLAVETDALAAPIELAGGVVRLGNLRIALSADFEQQEGDWTRAEGTVGFLAQLDIDGTTFDLAAHDMGFGLLALMISLGDAPPSLTGLLRLLPGGDALADTADAGLSAIGIGDLTIAAAELQVNSRTRELVAVQVRGGIEFEIGSQSFGFDVLVAGPQLVLGAQLAAGATIGVRTLVADVVGSSLAKLFPDATVTELSLLAQLAQDSLTFTATVENALELEVAGFGLSAEYLHVELTRVSGASPSTEAKFDGRLRLGGEGGEGGLLIEVQAEPSSAGSGWSIHGTAGLASGDPIDADAAFSSVLAKLGADIPMPPIDEVLDLELTGIDVTIDTGAMHYTVAAGVALDLHLFGRDLLSLTDTQVTVDVQSAHGPTPARKFIDVAGTLTTLGTSAQFQLHIESGAASGRFAVPSLRLGPMLQWFVELVRPGVELELPSPWDQLIDIDIGGIELSFDLADNTITAKYTLPSSISLAGIIELRGFEVTYQRRGKTSGPPRARNGAQFKLDATFNPIIFGDRFSDDELGWDLVNQSPPAVGPAIGVFDLRLLALGQHVGFRSTAQFNHVRDVTLALQNAFGPNDSTDPAAAAENPLVRSTALVFREESSWLIGASFDLLRFISLDAIWNDPDLYGLRIALAGPMAKSFAGLEFEILYKKITDEIGLFHVELVLPAAFRQLQFGAVSVTLPAIVVDIYTNGDFEIDLGFPYGGDFSRSFALQVFPFVGYGGFYFGKLSGATSNRIPKVQSGHFTTVIEVGLGLSVGIGKTIEKGPLSAGATLTLDAILEGVISWWQPEQEDADKVLYYRVDGFARLVGRLWGTVDFKIVSASFSVVAYASITLRIEVYEPIQVRMEVGVTVRASIKIAFVRIRFSFSTRISHSFSIGSRQTPPWTLAAANTAALRAGGIAALLGTGNAERLAAPTRDTVVPVLLTLMFTRDPLDAEGKTRPRGVALLTIRTGPDPDRSEPDDPATRPFQALAAELLRHLLQTTLTTRAELLTLAAQLRGVDPPQLELDALTEFMTARRVSLTIQARPSSTDTDQALDGAVFPMPPPLTLTAGGTAIVLGTRKQVPDDYLADVRALWQQASVSVGDEPPPHASGTGSIPEIVYRDWFGLIASGLVDRCLDALDEYGYQVPDTPKTRSITAILDDPPWGPPVDLDAAIVAFMTANRDRTGIFKPADDLLLNPLTQTIAVDTSDSFASLCARTNLTLTQLGKSGIAEIEDLLAANATVTLPDLDAAGTEDLIERVIASGGAEQSAALASRMLMHGLRLPDPDDAGRWTGLYDLLGQEFAIPSTGAVEITLAPTDADAPPSWLSFADATTKQTKITMSSTEAALAQQLAVADLDPIRNLELLPVLAYSPVRFALERSDVWRHADQAPQTLLSLPASLRASVADPATGALAGGPTLFELVLGSRPRPSAPVQWRDPGGFAWAIGVDLTLRRLSTADGQLQNGYMLLGSDDAGGDRLLQLMRHLDAGHESAPADLWLLTNAGSEWTSRPLDADACLVLKTNPETATVDDDEPLSASFAAATVADQRLLLRLLWEATTSGRGGFVLRYAEQSGAGLPASLFSGGVDGKLRLLLRLRSQRVEAGAAQVPVLPFNDCVVLEQSLDPDVDRLAVQARSHVVGAGDTLASIAAALGVSVATLRSANADVVGAFVDDQPVVGARLAGAPSLLRAIAPVPAGTVGLQLVRDNPTVGSTPAGQLDPDEAIDAIFSLLTCELTSSRASANGPVHFDGPLLQVPCRPIGPLVDDAASEPGSSTGDSSEQAPWRYELAVQPFRSLAAAFLAASEDQLPSSVDDPYGGIAAGAALTFAPAWGDVFGNIAATADGPELTAALRYSDHMRPLHSWPNCSASWWVDGRDVESGAPQLHLQLSFDAHSLTVGTDGAPVHDADGRAAMVDQLAHAYFQHRSSDVEFWLESSLGAPSLASLRRYPLDAVRVVDLVRGALLVLRELDQTEAVTDTIATGETLTLLGRRLAVGVGALRTNNPELADVGDDDPLDAGATIRVPGRIRLIASPAAVAPARIDAAPPGSPSVRAVALPTIAAERRSLTALAQAHGVDVVDLAVVNASLIDLVDASIAEAALGLPALAQAGERQTLANLYDRLLTADEAATFASMIATLASTANLLRLGARVLLPAPRLELDVTLDPQTPAPLFAIDVQLAGERTRDIDPRSTGVEAVRRGASRVPPRADLIDPASQNTGMRALAARFEAAYQTSTATDGVARYQGVKLLAGKEPDLDSALWGLRLSATGSPEQRYWYDVTQRTPIFYAVKPLATRLLSGHTAVRPYIPGVGMDLRPLPGTGDQPVTLEAKRLTDIDLDAWARLLLRTIDLTLAPERALGARRAAPDAYDQLIEAKQRLAAAISAGLASVLAHADGYDATGDLAAARAAFEDQLLVKLERAYTIDTLIQVRLATYGPSGSSSAPRLVGALRNVPIALAPGDTVVQLAERLGVVAGFLLELLASSPELFEGRPSQPGLDTPFASGVTLPLTAVEYRKSEGDDAETIADFYDIGLDELEQMTGKTTAQLTALPAGTLIRGVDRLPAYTLGSVEIPLAGAGGESGTVEYLTSFLDVLREGKDRKAFLDLDYVVTSLRHRIADVAGVPGVQRSSLLEFVLPLDAARTEAEADIGQTEIPLPLRDAPEPPVILRHVAQTEPPEDDWQHSDFERWIASLDDWSYRLDYSTDPAAQDELRLHVEFGRDADAFRDEETDGDDDQPEPDDDATTPDDTLLGWLAQFTHVLPLLERDLARLPAAADAEDPSPLAGPVQALAWLAEQTARAWASWTQPAPTPAATIVGHELREYRVETFLDADDEGWLSALRFTSGTSDDAGDFQPGPVSPTLYPASVEAEVARADVEPGQRPTVRTALRNPTVDADSIEFEYAPIDGQSHPPLPGDVRSHRVSFTDLGVLERSSARAGLRVIRNADLVTSAPVAREFVYQSPLVETQSFVQPYVRHDRPIELPTGASLADTLGRFFRALLQRVPTATRDFAVRVAYGYELVADTVLAPRVPVLNRTRFEFRGGVDDDPGNPQSFVREVAEALAAWQADERPDAPNQFYSFNVVTYDKGDKDDLRRPLLELSDVRVAITRG